MYEKIKDLKVSDIIEDYESLMMGLGVTEDLAEGKDLMERERINREVTMQVICFNGGKYHISTTEADYLMIAGKILYHAFNDTKGRMIVETTIDDKEVDCLRKFTKFVSY